MGLGELEADLKSAIPDVVLDAKDSQWEILPPKKLGDVAKISGLG